MFATIMKVLTAVCFSVLAFAAISQAQVCTPAPTGLVSWWPADGNALDPRSRNNGTLQNGASFAAGHVGQAFTFPNSNSSVGVTDSASLRPQALTIDAWITASSLPCAPCAASIAARTDSGGGGAGPPTTGYEFGMRENGILVFNLIGGVVFGNANVADGAFHHVAATYDSATLRLYVDGVLDGQQSYSAPIGYNPGDPLIIGYRQANLSFTTRWPGQIDELALYNRALSASEIQAIFNAGTAGKCKPTATVPPAGIAAWWPGDGNANDISGNNNHGTVQNGAGFAAGNVAQSFSFDGIDDFVDIANTPTMDFGTGDFALEFWMNLDSLASDQTLFHKLSGSGSSANDPTYFVEFNSPNALRFRVAENLSNANDLVVSTSLVAGQWYHVTAIREGSTNRLYLDGVLIGSQTVGSILNTGTGGDAAIGRCLTTSSPCLRFVDGRLDEVTLYNRALTQDEITSIFNAGSAGKLKLGTTAADVEISGRVVAVDGRGIASTRVTLTGSDGSVRTALSNPFGYYRFDRVLAGTTYIVAASRKGYRFAPRVVTVDDEIAGLDLVAVQTGREK